VKELVRVICRKLLCSQIISAPGHTPSPFIYGTCNYAMACMLHAFTSVSFLEKGVDREHVTPSYV
jgi:hypothetical protein